MNTYTFDRSGPAILAPAMSGMRDPGYSRLPTAYESEFMTGPEHDEVCGVIQDLIEITCDGEEGFTHAATHVHDRGLRDEFMKFARERKSMVSELNTLMMNYDNQMPEPRNSLGAALHRAWMNIRTVVTQRDDQAILEEAERGEDVALDVYRSGRDNPVVPAAVKAVIRALLEKVQRAHDRVHSLRDSGLYDHGSHA